MPSRNCLSTFSLGTNIFRNIGKLTLVNNKVSRIQMSPRIDSTTGHLKYGVSLSRRDTASGRYDGAFVATDTCLGRRWRGESRTFSVRDPSLTCTAQNAVRCKYCSG